MENSTYVRLYQPQYFTEEEKCLMTFACSGVIGHAALRAIKKLDVSFVDFLQAKEDVIAGIIGLNKAQVFCDFRRRFTPDSVIFELYKKHIHVYFPYLSGRFFPVGFSHDMPLCLFTRGNEKLLSDDAPIRISIIGTRKPSSYGLSITETFTQKLVHAGFTIISGMALGIDGIAHQVTLKNSGSTIAILGSGIDVPYPGTNERLYNEILDSDGLIVSEYPPGAPALPLHFVKRNWLIAALAHGLLIVEGAKKSGTNITARYANDLGTNTFAVPGSIYSPLSSAPHHIIQQGAKLVTSPEEIIDDFPGIHNNAKQTVRFHFADERTQDIYENVTKEAHSSEELASSCNLEIHLVMAILTHLEIDGFIKQLPDGTYFKT